MKYICDHCGKEFTRQFSLTKHINTTHLHKTLISGKILCRKCNKEISKVVFIKHMIKTHGYSLVDSIIESSIVCNTRYDKDIPENLLSMILKRLNGNVKENKDFKYYNGQINSFFRAVKIVRESSESDVDLFIDDILPWKLKHPNQSNNREYTRLICKNDPENEQKLYNELMLFRNPFYQHDGTYSAFSKDFVGYIGMTEEEKEKSIADKCKYDMVGRNPNQKEYWMKRGYSEEESINMARQYINVFSLETCINKYGEIEGRRRFEERQIKWQKTMNSKPLDEIQRINHDKVYKNGPKSGVEKEFLDALIPDERYHNVYLKDLGIVDLLFNNKIIEFYGDYWHCNPKEKRFTDGTYFHPYLEMTAKEKWDFDENRISKIKKSGYEVKIIWESDYYNNKTKVIQECKEFMGINQ